MCLVNSGLESLWKWKVIWDVSNFVQSSGSWDKVKGKVGEVRGGKGKVVVSDGEGEGGDGSWRGKGR